MKAIHRHRGMAVTRMLTLGLSLDQSMVSLKHQPMNLVLHLQRINLSMNRLSTKSPRVRSLLMSSPQRHNLWRSNPWKLHLVRTNPWRTNLPIRNPLKNCPQKLRRLTTSQLTNPLRLSQLMNNPLMNQLRPSLRLFRTTKVPFLLILSPPMISAVFRLMMEVLLPPMSRSKMSRQRHHRTRLATNLGPTKVAQPSHQAATTVLLFQPMILPVKNQPRTSSMSQVAVPQLRILSPTLLVTLSLFQKTTESPPLKIAETHSPPLVAVAQKRSQARGPGLRNPEANRSLGLGLAVNLAAGLVSLGTGVSRALAGIKAPCRYRSVLPGGKMKIMGCTMERTMVMVRTKAMGRGRSLGVLEVMASLVQGTKRIMMNAHTGAGTMILLLLRLRLPLPNLPSHRLQEGIRGSTRGRSPPKPLPIASQSVLMTTSSTTLTTLGATLLIPRLPVASRVLTGRRNTSSLIQTAWFFQQTASTMG